MWIVVPLWNVVDRFELNPFCTHLGARETIVRLLGQRHDRNAQLGRSKNFYMKFLRHGMYPKITLQNPLDNFSVSHDKRWEAVSDVRRRSRAVSRQNGFPKETSRRHAAIAMFDNGRVAASSVECFGALAVR